MKISILLLSFSVGAGFALAGCAGQENAPSVSAATGPGGVGTSTETSTGQVSGLGAGVGTGVHGGGN